LTISKKVFTVPATSALVECLLSETGKVLNPLQCCNCGGLAETVTNCYRIYSNTTVDKKKNSNFTFLGLDSSTVPQCVS